MAIKKEEIAKTSPEVKRRQQLIGMMWAAVCLLMCVGVIVYNNIQASRKITVAWVKESLAVDTPLTPANIVPKEIAYSSFEDYGMLTHSKTGEKRRSIILWSERSSLENAVAGYYLRGDSPLTWDALSYERTRDLSYLYLMEGELVKLDINGQEFGEILVPGDKINVRVSYTAVDYSLQPEEVYLIAAQNGTLNSSQGLQGVTKEFNIKLFNNASILDILNASGESIYDIYLELLKQPRNAQLAMLASPDFKTRVAPSKLMLQVTPEEADHYMEVKSNASQYLTTLLPREEGNIILDTIADLTMELAKQQVGN